MQKIHIKSFLYGLFASISLLVLYFVISSLVSEPEFVKEQFALYWYFIISLALGFGIQVGLYVYLRNLIADRGVGGVLGITGTTSTVAMISCCAHYLVNLLPILGVAAMVTFVAQYQIELFWVGILFNLAGVSYMANKIFRFTHI